MNNKIRKQRLWRSEFLKKYHRQILDVVEQEMGEPADCLCVYIAKLAERLSAGKLTTQKGILVAHDQGMEVPPMSTSHCWNMFNGQIFDLSPLASRYCKCIEYLTEDNGEKYTFYERQTIMFKVSLDSPDLQADINRLVTAFHSRDLATLRGRKVMVYERFGE